MHENIAPIIDRGVFHNFVHVCKQLFCVTLSEDIADTSFTSFLPFYKGVTDERKTMAQWINLLWNLLLTMS